MNRFDQPPSRWGWGLAAGLLVLLIALPVMLTTCRGRNVVDIFVGSVLLAGVYVASRLWQSPPDDTDPSEA